MARAFDFTYFKDWTSPIFYKDPIVHWVMTQWTTIKNKDVDVILQFPYTIEIFKILSELSPKVDHCYIEIEFILVNGVYSDR